MDVKDFTLSKDPLAYKAVNRLMKIKINNSNQQRPGCPPTPIDYSTE